MIFESFFCSIGRNLSGFVPKMKIFGENEFALGKEAGIVEIFTMENSPILVEITAWKQFCMKARQRIRCSEKLRFLVDFDTKKPLELIVDST